ncbi:hypothetical protein FPOA_06425 [Fusarium poae]|uniref:Uncharacterized protein n=1 Tax=Fusarium poae TaxID=36050 RepID=A0A1B8AZN5_FUSPO|nr:hypothetical protein FPOA_06425 [Fusarium poae]
MLSYLDSHTGDAFLDSHTGDAFQDSHTGDAPAVIVPIAPGPSRRLAIIDARLAVDLAAHCTLAAAENFLAGRIHFYQYRAFLWQEIAARAALAALEAGLGDFRG